MLGFRKFANYTEVFYRAQDSPIHISAKSNNCNIKSIVYQKITCNLWLELSTEDSNLDYLRDK